jgi:hypothetical protein
MTIYTVTDYGDDYGHGRYVLKIFSNKSCQDDVIIGKNDPEFLVEELTKWIENGKAERTA